MSSLEEKKCLLNQIIKNCNHAEHQLKKFKKSLQQEEGLENSWKNQSFIAKQP
jgi:ribosomal protein S21